MIKWVRPGQGTPIVGAQAAVMACEERAQALAAAYRGIDATRMAGVPVRHAALQVVAIGFASEAHSGGAAGVLVTPWFMNLVWFPLGDRSPDLPPPLRVGQTRARRIGSQVFDFIGAHEDGFGPFEGCSLFSPMFEFVDQASAVATAEAVLALLRAPRDCAPASAPGRRRFLLGRAAA